MIFSATSTPTSDHRIWTLALGSSVLAALSTAVLGHLFSRSRDQKQREHEKAERELEREHDRAMRREDRAYGRMAEAYLAIAHYVGVALNYLDGLSRSVVMGSPRPPDLNADDPDRFSTVFASATAFATDDVRKSLEEFARRATQASQGVALVENAAGAARAAPGDEEILRDYQASTVMLKSALVGAHDEGRALVTRINRELRTDVPK